MGLISLGAVKLTGLILLGAIEITGFNFYWTKTFLIRYGSFSAAFGWVPLPQMHLPYKGQVQIRVQICPPRSMFSKFNYFDIVASLHKYACYQINKNPYHGHLWIIEAREKWTGQFKIKVPFCENFVLNTDKSAFFFA